jgi:hypothetical protein
VLPTAIEGLAGVSLIEASVGTVKFTALLDAPLTMTTKFPVVAPFGTGTAIEVGLHEVGVAFTPLKVTVATV